MKRKDFMRGFGCGAIIAAVIFGITVLNTKPTVTDAEIMARAEALGMMTEDEAKEKQLDEIKQTAISGSAVSSEGLADEEKSTASSSDSLADESASGSSVHVSENNGAVATGATIVSSSAVEEKDNSASDTSKSENNKSASEGSGTSSKQSNESANTNEASASYTLTIRSGMYSEQVSEALANAGIIGSSSRFNSYLIRHGYAEKIRAGSYTLTKGMTYAEIAQIITR